jgi:hypothetical protein
MMAGYVRGKPIMQEHTPATAYNAGDVIIVGTLPCVAHEDNPPFTGAVQSAGGTATIKDALSIFGGIYQMAGDSTLNSAGNGTDVYWDATNHVVTTTAAGHNHFGKVVGGPNGSLDDGGPINTGDPVLVFHCPALLESGASISSPLTITSNSASAIAAGRLGGTTPALQVDASTATSITGLLIKSAASTGGLAVKAQGETNVALTLDANGTGTLTLNGTATGNIVLGRAATGVSLAVTAGLTSSGGTGAGIGYATGAGGAVTQITTRTTGVTLSKLSGAITLVSAAGSATPFTFVVTNTTVAATDTIEVCQQSGTDAYAADVSAVAAGSFKLTITDITGTTTETPVFNFAVLKAVAA